LPTDVLKRYQHLDDSTETNSEQHIIDINREIQAQHRRNGIFDAELSVSDMVVNGKRLFIGIIRDISERKKMQAALVDSNEQLQCINQQLEKSATTDALTQLANRRCFDETLSNELKRAARKNLPLTLLLCDIDYFKQYNDTYGHQAGDQCLQQVAKVMANSFRRSGDLVARYGGEEFAIILPNTSSEAAGKLSERLRQSIEDLNIPHKMSQVSGHLSLSIGYFVAFPTTPPIPTDKLLKKTDEALYEAKSQGRNCVYSTQASSDLETL